MKYPFVEIKFHQNCSEDDKNIIERYWEIENNSFKIKPSELSKELDINNNILSKIVKSNSDCFLHIQECLVCTNEIIFKVTSQSSAKKLLENKRYNCDSCKSEFNTSIREVDSSHRKSHRMNYALTYKFWNRLEKSELDVLRKILEFNDFHTFRKQYLNSNFEFAWPIIEKLDNLALIDIRGKGDNNRPIRELYYLPELAEELKTGERSNYYVEKSLNFHIPKHHNPIKKTQPKFFKRIVFDKDIVLKKGIEYFCSVWENSDGSINLGIKAKSDIPNRNTDNTNDEPKRIGDLIPEHLRK